MTIPPPPGASAPMGGEPSSDDKTMALLAHFGIVLFGFIAPIIVYLVKGDSPWVKNEAAKAFNFSVIFDIVLFLTWIPSTFLGYGIGSVGIGCLFCIVILAAWAARAAFGIMNGIKINSGEVSKYPFEIPILK